MRTLRPDAAAAVKTAKRNSSFDTACEQLKVKTIPPGATFLKRCYCLTIANEGITQDLAVLSEGGRIEDDQVILTLGHTL